MDILNKLLFDLELSGMSTVTQKNYVYHVSRFADHCKKPLQDTDIEDVRNFLHYLRYSKKHRIGTVNYYHTCIKFLFEITLEKPWSNRKVPRLRGYRKLPVIPSRQDIDKLLRSMNNLKYKAIRDFLLKTCKSAGITTPFTTHLLLHCFATHLLEAGVNILNIKVLLGHSCISSTCRYLHFVNQNAFNIKSPLDMPMGDDDA